MANVYASVCPSGLDRTPVAAMSDDEDSDWCSAPPLVDLDDEDSDESVSPPWTTHAACEWASFAHRLLLRQELRDKHYMMRRRQDCSKLKWMRQNFVDKHYMDAQVTAFV